MRILTSLKKSLIISLVASAVVMAGDYVVIVNSANSLSSISKAELKRVFTGKMQEIDGKKAVPVNMSYESTVAQQFLTEVTEKSAADYKKFWMEEMIKGNGTAPMIKADAGSMKAIVSQIPGAIGYVPASEVDATVKKITVN